VHQQVHKKSEITMFKSMIDEEYRVHWLLDNLPVAVRNGERFYWYSRFLVGFLTAMYSLLLETDELGFVTRGYPIGFISPSPASKKPQHYLFNHVRIVVRYHENPLEFEGARIVGFEVVPFSIKVWTPSSVILPFLT
jgi:transmembrane 9 superfamily protein 2/4